MVGVDRQARPCMGRCMGGAWGVDVVRVGKMQCYTTWISEVGLGTGGGLV